MFFHLFTEKFKEFLFGYMLIGFTELLEGNVWIYWPIDLLAMLFLWLLFFFIIIIIKDDGRILFGCQTPKQPNQIS